MPLSTHKKQASASSLANSATSPSVDLSPELVPVVTLLSAQSHRRYIESNFMLLRDLNNEGQPSDRSWYEVYGVLSGFQLAMWDADSLSNSRGKKENFTKATKKLEYLNLADATFKPLLSMPSSGKPLNNVILVSTTMKNRFILQFKTKELLFKWHAAFRLASFEYVSLQEAYTGALLSAKGSRLSDIKVILAESKYNYEHWALIRFGAGGSYRKYYVVVETHPKKKKMPNGRILVYEHDKIKRAPLVAEIVSSSAVYAVYPNAPQMVDTTTLIKVDGKVVFNKKEGAIESSVFFMPETHSSVPGYDTLIRFLIPALDAFKLYGRPKKLNADKKDPDSLLFGLPVLPHVHYLQLEEAQNIADPLSAMMWPVSEWTSHLKDLLKQKMMEGYSGCGSTHGIDGALNSPALGSPAMRTDSPTHPNFVPTPKKKRFSGLNDSKESTVLADNKSINMNHSNISLDSKPLQAYNSYEAPNPYGQSSLDNSPYNNGKPSAPGNQLPLPSDRSNNNLDSSSDSNFYNTAVIGNNSGAPLSLGKGLPLPLDNMGQLPLPSDMKNMNGLSNNNISINNPYDPYQTNQYESQQGKPSSKNMLQHLQIPSDKANLAIDQDPPNKRMSEITQIYSDYAKLPSPGDSNLTFALNKLSVNMEVDDDDFDLDHILSQTKVQEKRNSKLAIDIFNPDYSEALLSPSLDSTNPFSSSVRNSRSSANIPAPIMNSLAASTYGKSHESINSSNSNPTPYGNPNNTGIANNGGGYFKSSVQGKRVSQNAQPTLPQINIDDDDDEFGGAGVPLSSRGPNGPRALPNNVSQNGMGSPYGNYGGYH
ncbi:Caf120 protein [Saccharomycopsis crataegensis]|uniref:Caf120 protein n=1 Tax=Saccharomycopsis crataegensis TaxID=43959 RepID=A0AAV5QMY6_9ASCO|nr:Caf120 protein [Saccharomycopsis crataegensis]